ncbi:MAG: CDP-diacylglycerol--glycerol-3-phosphate 3-phosphatidyltransferase [Lysobacteraceae bacterium]|nr:MAG: CDP-diacylglycerol--glycerol-3-phosphate 3-phosphatidyltransferase [Xanthomonadaceae bacterium]
MLTVPTLLTFFRILLIPVLVAVFYLDFRGANLVAAAIFGLAAITDALDGYLARRLGQISRFGEFLDPVADKLMVAVTLVILVQRHPSIWMALPAAIIIGREITISALREWMAELGERGLVKVALLGKIKTIAQMAALILLLIGEQLWIVPALELGQILLIVAAALTIWSMVVYLRGAWPTIRDEPASRTD